MKLLHIFCILVSLGMSILIVLQFPKAGTTRALKHIEGHYLRPDLTETEQAQYESYKGWIVGNDRVAASRLATAKYLGLGACVALLIQSLAGLRRERNRRRAESGRREG